MARLLIVDDEAGIRELIVKYALKDNHICTCASSGEMAVELALSQDFDLIIMDVMMGNMDGFEAVRQIRKVKDIPVIMLTALNEEYNKIHGFTLGVDDYVVKPFSTKELMMRVNAILKRANKQLSDRVYKYNTLEVDYEARVVSIDNKRIKLSLKEYELLIYLIKNKNIALTREQILSTVWGYDFYGDDRTLDTHIKLLRKNLQDYARCIVTLRGVGYRFEEN